MPVEVLAEDQQRQARDLVVHRLVDGGVDHRPVHSGDELQVDHRFEVRRGEGPGGVQRGHRLGGDQVLAIYVGDRGRALDVGDIGGVGALVAGKGPHRRHRNVGVAAHGHVVAERRAPGFQRLAIDRQAVGVGGLGHLAVVLTRDEVRQGAAEVVQEAVALAAGADDDAGQGRQPGPGVVPTKAFEIVEDLPRPVGSADLDAVGHQHAQPAPPDQVGTGRP